MRLANVAARFMYSNVYGVDGPTKLIQLMKTEILNDAAQIGISDFQNIPSNIVSSVGPRVQASVD